MKRLLKFVAWLFGALLLLMIIAAIALPLLFDPNDYRDEIGALVKRQTGRELIISGDLKLSVFPWLGVEAGATQLANAPGFGPAPFAQFDHANVRVKLLPLLRREVEVDTVELQKLQLNLARARDGRTNWDDLLQGQQQEQPPATPSERRGIESLRVGGVRLLDAQILWRDQRAGREARLTHLNLVTGALDLHSPVALQLDTDFSLDAPQVAGHVALNGKLHHDMEAQRFHTESLALDLNARGDAVPGGDLQLALRGDGKIDLKAQTAEVNGLRLDAFGAQLVANAAATQILDKPSAQGDFVLQVKDGKTLLTALKGEIPAHLVLEPKSLSGARVASRFNLSLARDTAELPNLRANLLGTTLDASVTARQLTAKPAAKGALRLVVNDGNALLAPFAASLPKGVKPDELSGALFESSFDLDLATGRATLGNAKLNALGLKVAVDLQATALLTKPAATGSVSLAPFAPRDLLPRFGIALPPMADATTLTKASLTTRFDVGLDHAALQNLVLRVDQSTLTGRIAAQRFEPLVLRYDLVLDQIDADRYLAPPRKEAPAATTAATAPLQLPLKAMRALDIDGTVRVGKLKVAQIRSAEVLATLRAKGGEFRLNPSRAQLYEGRYSGDLGLDVRGETPLLSMNETLTGIQVGPLLKDFMGKEYVSGKAQLHAQLTARGTQMEQIRRTLNGNALFSFQDGAVNGMNLGQLLRNAYAKYKGQPPPKEETRKTDFAELRGSVTVKDGQVSNDDLTARSPLLRVAGQGTANLATEKINYRVNTTVVSSFEGQGSLAPLQGVTVPVVITGTFGAPQFGVDVASVLKEKAQQALDAEKQKLQKRLEEERKRQEEQLKKQLQEKLKDMFKIK